MNDSRRILFDTNVWRALTDADAGQQLSSIAKQRNWLIVVAPCTVYETLRLEDVATRNRILRVQTSKIWTRLMPEAFSECSEILSEVRRLHPNWLKPSPDLAEYQRQVRDWTRGLASSNSLSGQGFWNRVRQQPDWMANATRSNRLEEARIETKAAQADDKRKATGLPQLEGVLARLPNQPSGTEVEAWRWPALDAFTSHILEKGSAYGDWLNPWFKILPGNMSIDLWRSFWISECNLAQVPRQWLRWAFSYYQTFVKWTSGTPGDEQLSSYLPECDQFVSADKTFIRLLSEIRKEAPFILPIPNLVRAGREGVTDLFNSMDI